MFIFSPPIPLPLPNSQFQFPSTCPTLVSAAAFRRRTRTRRRHNKLTAPTTTFSEPKLETVMDLTHLTTQASSTLQTLFPSFHSNLRQFLSSGRDAYTDLQQTLLTLDHNRRFVVSCRPSTLHFLATSALFTFLAFSVLRFLGSTFSSWHRNASNYNNRPMVRRDRSLGGREVVVGWADTANPLSPLHSSLSVTRRPANNNVRFQRKLPKWWPPIPIINLNTNGALFDVSELQEYKREAYRVVRAIVDGRMGGNDIMENDIIQLRQLCRTSGAQVSIEPTNIRDSLYRASVNFVLNVCSRAPTYSTSIDINGEDARKFLAGFAENIGLQNVRAATVVSAAVAARTRSYLLQAWALEMQGKHVDAMVELSKICLLLQIFPPEESSPEMEMVGRGLAKHLKLEQRKHLMFLFGEVCGEDSHRIAREALGLMHSQNCCSDQPEDNIA